MRESGDDEESLRRVINKYLEEWMKLNNHKHECTSSEKITISITKLYSSFLQNKYKTQNIREEEEELKQNRKW